MGTDKATPTDPIERAVEHARTSDRLAAIERLEEEERSFHGQLLSETRSNGGKLDRLIELAEAREHRESARLEREELDRAEARKWWRNVVSEKVLFPIVASLVSGFGAITAAWASGMFH
jgi:hypothetical protein